MYNMSRKLVCSACLNSKRKKKKKEEEEKEKEKKKKKGEKYRYFPSRIFPSRINRSIVSRPRIFVQHVFRKTRNAGEKRRSIKGFLSSRFLSTFSVTNSGTRLKNHKKNRADTKTSCGEPRVFESHFCFTCALLQCLSLAVGVTAKQFPTNQLTTQYKS